MGDIRGRGEGWKEGGRGAYLSEICGGGREGKKKQIRSAVQGWMPSRVI